MCCYFTGIKCSTNMTEEILSYRTKNVYEREVKRFYENYSRLFGSHPDPANVESIKSYLSSCYPEFVPTVSCYRVHIAAIKKWIVSHSIEKPIRFTYPRLDEQPIIYLDPASRDALFAALGDHICGVMLRLMYYSGMRMLEVTRVRVGDLDFENQTIQIRDEGSNPDHTTILPSEMKRELQKLAKGRSAEKLLFTGRLLLGEECSVSRKTILAYFLEKTEAAGLKEMNTYQLRNNFIINQIAKGTRAEKIKDYIGIKNTRVLNKYYKFFSMLKYDSKTASNDK